MVIRAKLGLLCLMALLMNWLEFKKLTNQEFADLYFDIDFVMNYLYASSTSYCKQQDITTFECPPCKSLPSYQLYNMTVSFTLDGSPQKVLYFVDSKNWQLVVAFQGTHNPQQILDQGINMHGMHYNLQDDIPEAIVDSFYLQTYVYGKFRESVEHNVKAMIAEYPRYQVIFTGHSLGGALTLMAAYDAVKEGWVAQKQGSRPSPMIYTFGQPRPGNQVFQKAVDEKFEGTYYRVTHHRDIIPHIPPCVPDMFSNSTACIQGTGTDVMWYPTHAGIEIFFEDDTAENYKVCEEIEDLGCADQYYRTSIEDHLFYLGIWDNCPGDGDH